jgi:hypothetical protein
MEPSAAYQKRLTNHLLTNRLLLVRNPYAADQAMTTAGPTNPLSMVASTRCGQGLNPWRGRPLCIPLLVTASAIRFAEHFDRRGTMDILPGMYGFAPTRETPPMSIAPFGPTNERYVVALRRIRGCA